MHRGGDIASQRKDNWGGLDCQLADDGLVAVFLLRTS